MEVKLVVVQGRPLGKEIPLPSTVFVIGRDAKCHLRPHCELVSQLHCAIARQGGRVVLRDLHSSNGTFINDRPIEGQMTIKDGDTLRVGTLAFAFRIAADQGEPRPVQLVDEDEWDWLFHSPADSSVLGPERTARLSAMRLQEGAPPHTRGSRTVSAGEYLKESLRRPKA